MFINLARVSDLNVTRTKPPWKQIPPHTIVEITRPPRSFRQCNTRMLTKNTLGLGGKITKPIRNQTHGEGLGSGIRRRTTKTIGNVAQGKRPGRGNGGISSEFVNKWSIISVDMDCLPG